MELGDLIPFREALRRNAVREALPTHLSTAELQQIDAGILRSSFFSARNTLTTWLNSAKAKIERILNPTTEQRADRVTPENPDGNVTTGLDPATARMELRDLITSLGYQPDPEKRGTIEDMSSDQRINLVIKTNREIAQGYGHWMQGQDADVLDEWPASELFRAESRKDERDWSVRWLAAARESGDSDAVSAYGSSGRMVALKDSPIWQALGDGAGGFDSDALHNPYPPFAFNSGMDVMDVTRDDAMDLGLIDRDTVVVPQTQEFAANLPEEIA